MDLRFTLVVTVYQREGFLPHVFECIRAQSEESWELIVLSDGPSPVARDLCQRASSQLNMVYEELPDSPGLHGNHLRRHALEMARGRHICFVGHDCLLFPTYLTTHRQNLEDDESRMSLVQVAFWRDGTPEAPMPRVLDPTKIGETEIDLLCIAFPTQLTLDLDCFGEVMLPWRQADYLAFNRLRQFVIIPPITGPIQGAHF